MPKNQMSQRICLSIIVLLGLLLTSAVSPPGESVYTPASGSPERQAIMDVVRLDFYSGNATAAHRNAKGILFNVRYLKVHGEWALVCVDPVNAAGKEIAEFRWGLLHRNAGQWSDAKYFDAIRPYSSEESAQDALDMTASTIRKIWQTFPDAPKDIFPDPSRKRP
jgi:hypothetical protein